MRGLIEKDIRLLLLRRRLFVLFAVMGVLLGYVQSGFFAAGYVTILSCSFVMSLANYDEFDNSVAFLMTLPASRKQFVLSRYISGGICLACGFLLGVCAFVAAAVIRHDSIIFSEVLPGLTILIPVFALFLALVIPVQYKFGADKGRVITCVIIGVMGGLVMIGRQLFSEEVLIKIGTAIDKMGDVAILGILLLVSIVGVIISMAISISIIEAKEF